MDHCRVIPVCHRNYGQIAPARAAGFGEDEEFGFEDAFDFEEPEFGFNRLFFGQPDIEDLLLSRFLLNRLLLDPRQGFFPNRFQLNRFLRFQGLSDSDDERILERILNDRLDRLDNLQLNEFEDVRLDEILQKRLDLIREEIRDEERDNERDEDRND